MKYQGINYVEVNWITANVLFDRNVEILVITEFRTGNFDYTKVHKRTCYQYTFGNFKDTYYYVEEKI